MSAGLSFAMTSSANYVYNAFAKLFAKKEVKIVIVGLNGAGKTSVLYWLKLDKKIVTLPTYGFNIENVDFKNISLTMWDLGTGDTIRSLYRHYFPETSAVIFIIDSADRERFDHAKDELYRLMSDDNLKDKLLLVFANKQDLTEALSVTEIKERLQLEKAFKNMMYHVQLASALNGEGLKEGLEWLGNKVMNPL